MKSWESVLVSPETSLSDAVARLDAGGMQIVLVVDADRRLLGTITDGDIRRALLRKTPFSAPVSEVMSRAPHALPAGSTPERILALLERHQLLQVPIVDREGRVVGLETLHGLLHRRKRDNVVFLMAGGFGKRLQPLTDSCPKPLLKVGDKPILELILENFIRAGFHRFFISTHYMGQMIHDHFGDGGKWGATIRYVHEETPLGTAGALGLLPREEIDLPLFMMNGDLLTNLNFDNLLKFHEEHGGAATMCVREYEYRVPYGVVESDGHRVLGMVEKPVHKFFVNAGIYVVSRPLLQQVPRDTRIDMPTLLEQRMADGAQVNVFPVHEYWLDIGRMEDFQQAQFDVSGIFHG